MASITTTKRAGTTTSIPTSTSTSLATTIIGALQAVGWGLVNTGQALFLLVWSLIFMPLGAVAGLLGFRDWGLMLAHRTWAPGLIWVAGGRLEVRGLERVDLSKPAVLVVNHQSMIDIPALQRAFPTGLSFIAKQSLLDMPLLGHYMRANGMIGIDRGNTAAGIARLKAQAQTLHDDHLIVAAFAEGTRSRDGVMQPFKKGAFMLAITAQVPIVPVSIHGAHDVLPCDGFKVRPGVIRVDIGTPISTEGKTVDDRDALLAEAQAQVVAMNVAAGGAGLGKAR